MIILGVDPGPKTCGVVLWNVATSRAARGDQAYPTADLIRDIRIGGGIAEGASRLVIERPVGRNNGPVPKSVIDMSIAVGRMLEAWRRGFAANPPGSMLFFSSIAWLIVGTRANWERLTGEKKKGGTPTEAVVWAALLEKFGGHAVAVGDSKRPGALAVSGHARSAVAAVVAYLIRLELSSDGEENEGEEIGEDTVAGN